jgi:hypothetical protein
VSAFAFFAVFAIACNDPPKPTRGSDDLVGGLVGPVIGHHDAPPIKFGTPTITGASVDISLIAMRYDFEIAICYEELPANRRHVVDHVVATFDVDATGAVTSSAATGNATEVDRCVAKTLGMQHFAPIAGTAHVSLPIELGPT